MSAPQFTSGPWEVDGTHIYAPSALKGARRKICIVRDNPAANARLIAAAPKLHRALGDLLELVQVHGLEQCGDLPAHEFEAIVDGAVQDARKALAKATEQ